MPNDSNRPTSSRAASVRVWLRFGDHDVELAQGETIVGRSPRCQLVIDDPLVSRNHARIIVNRSAVTVEDLGSSNGVLVNGERLQRARVLTSGDQILIGKQNMLLLVSTVDASPSQRVGVQTVSHPPVESQPSEPPGRTSEVAEATRKGNVIDLLGNVVDKMLSLGRGEEAERMLGSYLRNLLLTARTRDEIDVEVAEKAVTYAVLIAVVTGKGTWVDYAFDLYSVVKRPLPAPVVERLYESLRKLSPVSAAGFRRYLSVLRSVETQFGPAERFLLRRIEGIESLGVLS